MPTGVWLLGMADERMSPAVPKACISLIDSKIGIEFDGGCVNARLNDELCSRSDVAVG